MSMLHVILGPTASGKTALAIALAQKIGGEVMNCDAMQMYADLPRLTAQPTEDERKGIPHHLFGVLAGNDKGQMARYTELARKTIADIRGRGRQPVLCGGTGLYFKALTEGLARIPAIPIVLHEMAVALHQDIGGAALRAKLAEVDPETAMRLNDGDTQRLIRAWEVYVGTGTPLSTWIRETQDTQNVESNWHAYVLLPPRDQLYEKINRRFDVMLQEGVVDEVRALLAKNYPADMPVMRAHGVPEIARYLAGGCTLAQAADKVRQLTRNYAKRQYTWFTHQVLDKHPERVTVISDFGASAAAEAAVSLRQKGAA
ncbi:MAG: tRNA (adenosine(37)-N6)-dimethylallyltransferase MiaA [Bdellovibrionales bacterium]